ncbi:MAG: hypothetical protein Q8P30_04040 [Candidatus Uhrbacteria bacterium]|nr:hypothetical protein [Candidatus Uhrbacteria bacterium]
MTITTHTAIGAAIGFSVGNPYLGFGLGLISHLLVDMIPHGDSLIAEEFRIHKKRKRAFRLGTTDALFALLLALFIFNLPHVTSTMTVSLAIAGSIFPDLIVGLHDATKSKYLKRAVKVHWFFHDFFIKRYHDVKLTNSLLLQAGLVAIIMNIL